MNQELARQVRDQFEAIRREVLVGFGEDDDDDLPKGYRQYKFLRSDGVAFFVVLEIQPKTDTFSIEVGWSVKGKYPSRILTFFPSDPPIDGSLRFRLRDLNPTFINERGRRGDNGWVVASPSAVAPALREAREYLVTRYLPYLRDLVVPAK